MLNEWGIMLNGFWEGSPKLLDANNKLSVSNFNMLLTLADLCYNKLKFVNGLILL